MTAFLEYTRYFLQFRNENVSITRASSVGSSSSSTGEKHDAINRPLFPGWMNHPVYYAQKQRRSAVQKTGAIHLP